MNETTKPERGTDLGVGVDAVVMPAVVGYVSYDVRVDCPHCGKHLYMNQFPYDDESTEYSLAEDELGLAVFGTATSPATWQGLSVEYKCMNCDKSFRITDLVT